MKDGTKDALRQTATSLLAESATPETARTAFDAKVETRFTNNAEGMTRDDYLAEAIGIWDQVLLQHNAKPAQGGQAEAGRRR